MDDGNRMKTMETLLARLNDDMTNLVKPQLAQLSDTVAKHSVDLAESSASWQRTESLLQSLVDKIDTIAHGGPNSPRETQKHPVQLHSLSPMAESSRNIQESCTSIITKLQEELNASDSVSVDLPPMDAFLCHKEQIEIPTTTIIATTAESFGSSNIVVDLGEFSLSTELIAEHFVTDEIDDGAARNQGLSLSSIIPVTLGFANLGKSSARIWEPQFHICSDAFLDESKVVLVSVYGNIDVDITGIQHDARFVPPDNFCVCGVFANPASYGITTTTCLSKFLNGMFHNFASAVHRDNQLTTTSATLSALTCFGTTFREACHSDSAITSINSFVLYHSLNLHVLPAVICSHAGDNVIDILREDLLKLDANETPYGSPPEVMEDLGSIEFPYMYLDPGSHRMHVALIQDSSRESEYDTYCHPQLQFPLILYWNRVTVNVVEACKGLGDPRLVGVILLRGKHHGVALVIEVHVYVLSYLIDFSAKHGEKCNLQHDIDARDSVSWHAIIAGYTSTAAGCKARHLLCNLVFTGMLLFASKECAQLVTLPLISFQSYNFRNFFLFEDTNVENSWASLCTKCGYTEEAYHNFSILSWKDLISCISIFDTFGEKRQHSRSLSLLKLRLQLRTGPDSVAILAIICFCAFLSGVEKVKDIHIYSFSTGSLLSDSAPTFGNTNREASSKCGKTGYAIQLFQHLTEKMNLASAAESQDHAELGIKHWTILPTHSKKWDPGGNGYFFWSKSSLQFKQWDPGGDSLVHGEGSLNLEAIWVVATIIQHYYLGFNLEDKVAFNGRGNVMIPIEGKPRHHLIVVTEWEETCGQVRCIRKREGNWKGV